MITTYLWKWEASWSLASESVEEKEKNVQKTILSSIRVNFV